MLKKTILIAAALGLTLPLFPVFPFFHGARALALGYSSLAFNYDVNALFLNPALLGWQGEPLAGYQYGRSELDFRDVSGALAAARAFDLEHFQSLGAADREAALQALRRAYEAGTPAYGFRAHGPGYAGKGYAVSVSSVDAAVVGPLANAASAALDRPAAELGDADIAALRVRFTGLQYTDYALAVGFPLGQGTMVGATLHYLRGKRRVLDAGLGDALITARSDAGDMLHAAWSGLEDSFSKFTFDLGAAVDLGPHFRAGLAVKNAGQPAIAAGAAELRLARRTVAGLAFRPDAALAICLDIDLVQAELVPGGGEAQPFALGVEKGLFRNKLLLRAGMVSDLAASYFVGRRSNALYGLGAGFNLGKFLIDLALAFDSHGQLKNLGFSGFYALR